MAIQALNEVEVQAVSGGAGSLDGLLLKVVDGVLAVESKVAGPILTAVISGVLGIVGKL